MVDLHAQTLLGLKWSGAAQVARQLLQFTGSIILARLLSPREFGLMGMIVVFTGFAGLFSELGLGAALVQKQDLEDRHLNSIFWVNMAAGIVLTAISAFASAYIAVFFGEPILRSLTMAIALNFVLNSLNVVHRNLLVRAMDFRRLCFIDSAAIVLSGIAAIVGAWSGFGVWSLVAQSLVSTAVSAAMLWRLSTWRPAWSVDIEAIRELFGYSMNLLGFNALNYWSRNLDNLLIGSFIGPSPLGVYTRAYSLMLLPITEVTNVLTRVMFPALSAIQHDIEKVKRVYLQATRTIALVTFPMMVGLLVVAEPFILVVYGEQWREVVLIVRILCLAGIGQSIGTTIGWIFNSQGRTDIQLRWGLYAFFVTAIALIIGLRWGMIGMTWAYVLSGTVLCWYPSWSIAGRLINLRFGEMLRNLAQSFFCAAAMGVAVWLMGLLLPPHWSQWAYLAVQVSFGAMIYFGLIHLARVEAYLEVRRLITQQLHGLGVAPSRAT